MYSGSTQFSFTYFGLFLRWLSGFLLCLVVSVIFSLEHMKELFFQRDKKLRVRCARLILALLFMILITPPISDFHVRFIRLFFDFYHWQILHFAFFYNLIYAFEREKAASS